jgi:hypothetical protein
LTSLLLTFTLRHKLETTHYRQQNKGQSKLSKGSQSFKFIAKQYLLKVKSNKLQSIFRLSAQRLKIRDLGLAKVQLN